MDGVRILDFSVTLSAEEAAERLKQGLHGRVFQAELLDEYRRELPNGKELRLLVFQKYSLLANDRPILTVMLDELDRLTQVHICGASAVGGLLAMDIAQAGRRFAEKAWEILKE